MIWAGLRVLEADLNNPLSGRKLPVFSARVNERLTLSAFCKRGLVNVRFAPKATEVLRCRKTSLCANKRHMQCSKLQSIRSPRQPNREAKQACDLMGHCEFSPAIDFAHQGVDQIRTVDSRKIVRH